MALWHLRRQQLTRQSCGSDFGVRVQGCEGAESDNNAGVARDHVPLFHRNPSFTIFVALRMVAHVVVVDVICQQTSTGLQPST